MNDLSLFVVLIFIFLLQSYKVFFKPKMLKEKYKFLTINKTKINFEKLKLSFKNKKYRFRELSDDAFIVDKKSTLFDWGYYCYFDVKENYLNVYFVGKQTIGTSSQINKNNLDSMIKESLL